MKYTKRTQYSRKQMDDTTTESKLTSHKFSD